MKKIIALLIVVIPLALKAQHFGTSDHPMNKKTDNVEVLSFWKTNTPEKIEIYKAALKVFSSDSEANYSDLIADENFLELCKKNGLQLLGEPILGQINENGVSIWLRTLKPSKVQIVLSAGNEEIKSETISTKFDNDLTGIFEIEGLTAGTTYSYKVIIDDSIEVADENYHLTTLANRDDSDITRIAFGSCPHRWGLGNVQLFNTIKNRKPAAMLILGDIAVQDRNNHIGMHRADYLLRDFQTGWSDFASSIPVYTSWDDHDYFDNDKAGIPKGYTDKDRMNVRQIFKNSWVNPSYGLNEEGIYYKTTIGTCDVVMTDNRYFRTGKKGSFLGQQQMEWLKKQIIDCKSPFLILSCGSMWSDYVSNGKDSWGVNDPEGREEIFELIENKNISGVLFISGDRHGARGFTIQRESGMEFYEFGAASLGARVGPPKTKTEWTSQLYGIAGTFAFGEFTFSNAKNKEHVVFRLIKEDGDILYTKKLSLNDLTSKNN